jgi:hypothetical protein
MCSLLSHPFSLFFVLIVFFCVPETPAAPLPAIERHNTWRHGRFVDYLIKPASEREFSFCYYPIVSTIVTVECWCHNHPTFLLIPLRGYWGILFRPSLQKFSLYDILWYLGYLPPQTSLPLDYLHFTPIHPIYKFIIPIIVAPERVREQQTLLTRGIDPWASVRTCCQVTP